jgi:hypothetical protein
LGHFYNEDKVEEKEGKGKIYGVRIKELNFTDLGFILLYDT